MALPDTTIDAKLIDSARCEFIAHGFEKSSLKAICGNAGITTGALYKRYRGKEDLFCGVVADTLQALDEIVRQKTAVKLSDFSDRELAASWNSDNGEMLWWFQFMYERREDFFLLLACAQGTRYENFAHEWVERMAEETWPYLQEAQRRGLTEFTTERDELHILMSAYWETVFEPMIHGFSWEKLVVHSERVGRLFNWEAAIGIKGVTDSKE